MHVMHYFLGTGVLWPLEGMPVVLRYLGSILPMTYPAQAMRAAMGRGIHTFISQTISTCSIHSPMHITFHHFALLHSRATCSGAMVAP